MRSNFRPATNILIVVATFTIALNISPIAELYQEKNLRMGTPHGLKRTEELIFHNNDCPRQPYSCCTETIDRSDF